MKNDPTNPHDLDWVLPLECLYHRENEIGNGTNDGQMVVERGGPSFMGSIDVVSLSESVGM